MQDLPSKPNIFLQAAISSEGDAEAVARAVVNTILGGCSAGLSVLFMTKFIIGQNWSYLMTLNGAPANAPTALVASTVAVGTPWCPAPLAGDCFGMEHFGAIFGLIFTAYGFLSGPLGPWLSGYILDVTGGNSTIVFSYLGVMYLVSAVLIFLVRPWRECRL